MKIQMVDVVGQYQKIKPDVDAAIHRVLDSGMFIQGKEVGELESAMAGYLGVKHAVACASGTDALQIAMMAYGIGAGDEVITTPFTFVATAETIGLLGATPVYVDIDPATFNLDPAKLEAAITPRTRAIIPVHLYGQPADMDPIMAVARQRGIPVIEDAAQAMGASYRGKKVCSIGDIGCISFFPSKNLGCFGDGGMMVTNDAALAEKLRMIAAHGSSVRYYHEVLGVNSRLDTLQAAILLVKLRHLEEYNAARRHAAARYDELFRGTPVAVPTMALRCRAHLSSVHAARAPAGRPCGVPEGEGHSSRHLLSGAPASAEGLRDVRGEEGRLPGDGKGHRGSPLAADAHRADRGTARGITGAMKEFYGNN